jgi:hypothetical protein
MNPLDYYASHSAITDPGAHVALFADLPTDLPALHQIVQNVLIHVWKVRKYHPEWLEGRTGEYELRATRDLLAGVLAHDAAPLTVTRSEAQRLIVDCRHHATLLCALLRQQGVPARVRCGFATYLEDTHYQDHWVTEVWDGERWLLEDPDLMKHDVSRDEFITAGKAWQLARSGAMLPEQFGYSGEWRGWWVLRHDVIRDLAALNKFESLSSDNWRLIEAEEGDVTDDDRALLDRAAALTLVDNADFDAMRAFYDSQPAFHVPAIITCYNYIEDVTKTVDVGDLVG